MSHALYFRKDEQGGYVTLPPVLQVRNSRGGGQGGTKAATHTLRRIRSCWEQTLESFPKDPPYVPGL